MPGRNEHEAYQAFIDPIQRAVGCLGSAKITSSARRGTKPDALLAWALNGAQGMALGNLHLSAGMQFVVVRDETVDGGPWRVSTRGYRYAISKNTGEEVLSWHWHPMGQSPQTTAHLHLGSASLTNDGVLTSRTHVPTGRIAFEAVVRTLITDLDVMPKAQDWAEKLQLSEDLFRLYCSWHSTPPPQFANAGQS